VFLQSAAKPLQADIKLLNKIQSLIPQNVCGMTAFVNPYKNHVSLPCTNLQSTFLEFRRAQR